jgi:hypothetical protein
MIAGRKLLHLTLLAAVPVVGSVPLFLAPAGDDCRTINFEPGTEDLEKFSGAVFRVDDGGDIGTAFLVDATKGYLLTAKHVVKKTLANSSIPIIASSPALPGVKLDLLIVAPPPDYEDVDLALLQLKDPSKGSNITPLDISLRPPVKRARLTAMGYPTTYGDEININLRTPPADVISEPSEDGLIETSQVAIGGFSGGPLVDSTGLVVGICQKEVGTGNAIARYAPMSDAEPLLNQLPRHTIVDTLNSQVIKRSIHFPDLIVALRRGPGHASNLELYTWARYVLQNRSDYKGSTDYFSCPIIKAMMHRRLDDPVVWLSPFASKDDLARASLTVAERELALGHEEEAFNIISPVAGELAKSSDISLQTRALFVQTRAMANIGKGTEAVELLTSKANSLPPSSQLKGEILGQAALVNAIRNGAYHNGADDPMSWFESVMDSYAKAEEAVRRSGPPEELAELYVKEAHLLQRRRDFQESLDKLQLGRNIYRKIGAFQRQTDLLAQMIETSERFDKSQAIRYSKEYLARNPGGEYAEAATNILIEAGAKPQDLPGLHPSGTGWIITTSEEAPYDDHTCDGNTNRLVEDLSERLQQFAGPAISQYAGPLAAVVKGDSGSAAERLYSAEGKKPPSPCRLVCAVFPKDATVKDLELWSGEQNQVEEKCSPTPDGESTCKIGLSKWLKPVVVQRGMAGVACAAFVNGSRGKSKTASMTLTFRPKPGWHAESDQQNAASLH